jgi:hypothetical protein
VSHDTIVLRMPPTLRKPSPIEVPDVPEELLGFPERLTLARTMKRLQPSEIRSSRLERGIRVRGMTALTVTRLAAALGVRVGWLLRGEEPMWLPGREPGPPSAPESFEQEIDRA